LVGYVVLREGAEQGDVSGIRAYLKERLPEYMVPGVVVPIAAMPLTRTGKVDRNALPAAEVVVSAEEYVAPRTATEEVLAGDRGRGAGSGAGGDGGRLFRPGRAFTTGDACHRADTGCIKGGTAVTCHVRGADDSGLGGA